MQTLSPKLLAENERLVLNVIRRHGSISRAAITAETPLTQPWVHRLVDQLLARGLLLTGPPLKGTRGQPSVTLSLDREAAYAIGVAVETDSVRICVADLSCRVVAEFVCMGSPSRLAPTLELLSATVDMMLRRHGLPRERVVGLGLSLPGFFVHEGRQLNATEPLREWALIDLAPLASEAFGLPVTMQNSATAAAIGENLIGVGRWARTFCYLNFNYGFGSGIVIEGKPYLGRRGNAGEILFSAPKVDASTRPALSYLLADLRRHGVDVSSIEHIRERFDPNWPGVDAWMERVQPMIDQVVNAVAGLFDPDAIVFGGELPTALGSALIGKTTFWDAEHRYGMPPPRPRLVLAEGGSQATAVGAALQPLSDRFFS